MNLALIYPMAAMVALSGFVLVAMYRNRVGAVKRGEASAGYYKTFQEGGEPRHVAQLSRHVVNMFETPVLFYAAGTIGLVTGISPTGMLILAWAYVACRALHAYIHTGRNKLPSRIRTFFASLLVLLGMWVTLVVGVATTQ